MILIRDDKKDRLINHMDKNFVVTESLDAELMRASASGFNVAGTPPLRFVSDAERECTLRGAARTTPSSSPNFTAC